MNQDDQRFWRKVQKAAPDECWIWQGAPDANGYGRFSVGGRAGRQMLAHRYALGVTDPAISVLHSCDNPPCVNPAHLREGTNADNMRDMAVRERSRTTKLTASQVVEIRRLAEAGVSQRRLAREFGVRQGNIHAIVSRATWRHVA